MDDTEQEKTKDEMQRYIDQQIRDGRSWTEALESWTEALESWTEALESWTEALESWTEALGLRDNSKKE